MNLIPSRLASMVLIFIAPSLWILADVCKAQVAPTVSTTAPTRVRARELGVAPGAHPTGKFNAITDVAGVRVGQVTLVEGNNIRTGVTAILPSGPNVFQNKVPAAVVVGNAFGKLIGSTQVEELGEIETPILLTNTLNVWRVADALADYMLALPGNEEVRSINPIVGETNDGYLNDIRGRHVTREDVLKAITTAQSGPVQEGSIGAGTGTIAFGWKGGIGTSSRVLSPKDNGYTIGVLVQTNFGGRLTIAGVPVWKELQPPAPSTPPAKTPAAEKDANKADGSCMIVVATDAPLDARQLKRLGRRALAGMARAGSTFSNGSGDYVIVFSTAPAFISTTGQSPIVARVTLHDEELSPLFEAVADATEEAIDNSLFMATTVKGRDGHVAVALPLDKVNRILNKFGRGTERPVGR